MDDKGKKNIDPEGSRERKCCQQVLLYCIPTTYVEAADYCLCRKSICATFREECATRWAEGMQERLTGMKDQLLIGKQILKHCKKHQRNLVMGWIDHKMSELFGCVLHSLKCSLVWRWWSEWTRMCLENSLKQLLGAREKDTVSRKSGNLHALGWWQ